MKRLLLLIILTILAFATSACNNNKPAQSKSYVLKARNYTVEKGEDLLISDQVKCSLKNYYNLSMKAKTTTKVSTDKGIVTLKGRVSSDAERKTIINLVRQIPGVSKIIDQLVVADD